MAANMHYSALELLNLVPNERSFVLCVCVCVCGVFSYTHHRVVTDFNDNNDFNDYNDYNYYSIRYSCDVYIMHTQQDGKEKQN